MAEKELELTALFLDTSRKLLFDQHWPRIKTCVESLTTEQIWWRPNEASNSIGNLLLHLNGNVSQWIVTSFNHGEDKRNRPAEFAAKEGGTAKELLDRLGATLDEATQVLDRLTPAELLAKYEVQGYHTNGLYVVYHVVEHFGMHYGQIAYITKLLSGKDLGFYKDLTKTGRA
ncbi:MAG: DinB family protein [Terracidiphilus sp.]